jgi:hypothetical protein
MACGPDATLARGLQALMLGHLVGTTAAAAGRRSEVLVEIRGGLLAEVHRFVEADTDAAPCGIHSNTASDAVG